MTWFRRWFDLQIWLAERRQVREERNAARRAARNRAQLVAIHMSAAMSKSAMH